MVIRTGINNRGQIIKETNMPQGYRVTLEEFKARSREAHGDKYDYSKVILTRGIKTKIVIGCPEHGEFFQQANNHMDGAGCKQCANQMQRSPSLTEKEFLFRVNKKHNYKYRYLNQYKNSLTHLKIECTKHGEFTMLAGKHLRGYGCPRCAKEFRKIKEAVTRVADKEKEILAPTWKVPK